MESIFPNSRIYGIDIYDKRHHDEERITTFCGQQTDQDFLADVIKTMEKVDIIIDDGSYQNDHVIETFRYLFPLLSEHGIYAIEDIETSYWPEFGSSLVGFNVSTTTMGFLK